jgi:hypothetical protein
MRSAALAAAYLLTGTAVFAAGAEFAASLPEGVVDVAGWEQVSGEFDSPGFRGGYRFYVNPQLQGLYQVMRYRTSTRRGTARDLDAERVAFVRRPGTREAMLCWQRQPAGVQPQWRLLQPGSSEYVAEMGTLMRVIGAHRAATLARER